MSSKKRKEDIEDRLPAEVKLSDAEKQKRAQELRSQLAELDKLDAQDTIGPEEALNRGLNVLGYPVNVATQGAGYLAGAVTPEELKSTLGPKLQSPVPIAEMMNRKDVLSEYPLTREGVGFAADLGAGILGGSALNKGIGAIKNYPKLKGLLEAVVNPAAKGTRELGKSIYSGAWTAADAKAIEEGLKPGRDIMPSDAGWKLALRGKDEQTIAEQLRPSVKEMAKERREIYSKSGKYIQPEEILSELKGIGEDVGKLDPESAKDARDFIEKALTRSMEESPMGSLGGRSRGIPLEDASKAKTFMRNELPQSSQKPNMAGTKGAWEKMIEVGSGKTGGKITEKLTEFSPESAAREQELNQMMAAFIPSERPLYQKAAVEARKTPFTQTKAGIAIYDPNIALAMEGMRQLNRPAVRTYGGLALGKPGEWMLKSGINPLDALWRQLYIQQHFNGSEDKNK